MSAPDFYSMIVRQKLGLSEDWHFYAIKAVDTFDGPAVEIKGCIPASVFKSGPRKGHPNYSKPVAGSERTLIVSMAAVEAFKDEWQAKSGLCKVCGGTGWRSWGFGVIAHVDEAEQRLKASGREFRTHRTEKSYDTEVRCKDCRIEGLVSEVAR